MRKNDSVKSLKIKQIRRLFKQKFTIKSPKKKYLSICIKLYMCMEMILGNYDKVISAHSKK